MTVFIGGFILCFIVFCLLFDALSSSLVHFKIYLLYLFILFAVPPILVSVGLPLPIEPVPDDCDTAAKQWKGWLGLHYHHYVNHHHHDNHHVDHHRSATNILNFVKLINFILKILNQESEMVIILGE